MERRLGEMVGKDAGYLHAGRSRNDQVSTDFRLYLRDHVRHIVGAVTDLQEALLAQAEANIDTYSPGFTHLQHAQPVSFGHELAKHVHAFARDIDRLRDWDRRTALSPMGAGALAAYAKPGDHWVFYEIAPTVVDVAQSEFTFLKQSPAAKTDIVLGDGRLALEREPSRQYDLMAIDAFSGDSIPMHLLTREAFQVYMKHLKPDGVIIF